MCTKFAQAAACGWSCQGGGLDSQVESSGHLELSPKGSTARELARRKLHREREPCGLARHVHQVLTECRSGLIRREKETQG